MINDRYREVHFSLLHLYLFFTEKVFKKLKELRTRSSCLSLGKKRLKKYRKILGYVQILFHDTILLLGIYTEINFKERKNVCMKVIILRMIRIEIS